MMLLGSTWDKTQSDVKETMTHFQNTHAVDQIVWYLNEQRGKGKCPQFQQLWSVYDQPKPSNLNYHIQLNKTEKTKTAHHDKLRPYHGQHKVPWIKQPQRKLQINTWIQILWIGVWNNDRNSSYGANWLLTKTTVLQMGMMKCIEDGWEAELFSTKKSSTRHYNVCIFLSLNTPFPELYFVPNPKHVPCSGSKTSQSRNRNLHSEKSDLQSSRCSIHHVHCHGPSNNTSSFTFSRSITDTPTGRMCSAWNNSSSPAETFPCSTRIFPNSSPPEGTLPCPTHTTMFPTVHIIF